MNHFSCPHFGTIVALPQSIVPPQTHLLSKIWLLAPEVGGPDLMQPAIRLQESEFPETGPSLPITVQIFTTTHMGFGNIFIHKAK
jgi:hypothetical protein